MEEKENRKMETELRENNRSDVKFSATSHYKALKKGTRKIVYSRKSTNHQTRPFSHLSWLAVYLATNELYVSIYAMEHYWINLRPVLSQVQSLL